MAAHDIRFQSRQAWTETPSVLMVFICSNRSRGTGPIARYRAQALLAPPRTRQRQQPTLAWTPGTGHASGATLRGIPPVRAPNGWPPAPTTRLAAGRIALRRSRRWATWRGRGPGAARAGRTWTTCAPHGAEPVGPAAIDIRKGACVAALAPQAPVR